VYHFLSYNVKVHKLEFKIHRNIDQFDPEEVEYWVYEEVVKVDKRQNYVVIMMQDRSAIIPMNWVVEVREI
tara:strand:+ start:1002 stop:1214 length:213 start_codon:yes stop_codon:yes gene_type:complete